MFDNARRLGIPDSWIALPSGYSAGVGTYERVATGASQSLKMLREVNGFLGKLPRHRDTAAILIVSYPEELLSDSRHGRDIKREIDAINKKGPKVGVRCTTTEDVRRR